MSVRAPNWEIREQLAALEQLAAASGFAEIRLIHAILDELEVRLKNMEDKQ